MNTSTSNFHLAPRSMEAAFGPGATHLDTAPEPNRPARAFLFVMVVAIIVAGLYFGASL